MTATRLAMTADQLLSRITAICEYLETHEGSWLLFSKGRPDCMGQMIESKLADLKDSLVQLLNISLTHQTFVIDMRHHRYPLGAYCEFADVLRSIEEDRHLPKDSLMTRFVWLDQLSTAEYESVIVDPPTGYELMELLEVVRAAAPPVNNLGLAMP